MTKLKFPMITVYTNPADHPGKFVAHLFNMEQPTGYKIIRDDLEAIRADIPPHMVCIKRGPQDDPVIVENWI